MSATKSCGPSQKVRECDHMTETSHTTPNTHYTVLLEETLAMVNVVGLTANDVVVDGTLGQGGHTEAILEQSPASVIAIDADVEAIAIAKARLKRFGDRVTFVEGNFADMSDILASMQVAEVKGIVLDLGWNRAQLNSDRGFTFMADGPLTMSYSKAARSGFSAAEILNTWDESVIADVLYGYGEERYARRIAKKVVEMREVKPFETTLELVSAVESAVPHAKGTNRKKGKTNPATKTFQALRIAVNDEFAVIEAGLKAGFGALATGGRMAVISFHSSEDRIVKQTFVAFAKEEGTLLSKKPLIASDKELLANPSSRSAKLRGIQKN